jgi:hypothetical protein
MSSIIQIRNTNISGSTPSKLLPGELAINVTDGRLFYGSGSNNIVKEFPGSGNSIISASYLNPLHQDALLTGSLNITGSLNVSGSETLKGYLQLMPVTTNIDTSISASYIYVSGSTNDLYFSQNGAGYANTTRLRWLEGNLYTGLLNGGIIGSSSSTVFTVSSGSGIIVNTNASFNNNPYPTVQYVSWGNLSSSIAPLSASYDQSFVAINSTGNIITQGTPYTDGQFDTLITLGIVLHQNNSTINAVQTFPTVAYGWKQRSYDFIKAFGPLKISGYVYSPSGSSTGSLVVAGGTAWVDGRNYTINPNQPSYIVEAVGITTSKIYRYYQSGSEWGYDTNNGIGYTTIDPSRYSNNGVLTPVGTNDWTIQRVFYFPNSGTKALFVYYGNATYSNKTDALAAVSTETFAEAPNTAANALYLGYMVLRHNANFTVAASYGIYEAGLFRASGAGGAGGGGGTTLPGGSTTQIQYNNSSTFGGVPTLTYDGTTLTGTGSFSGSFTGTLTGTASYASTASFLNSTTNAFIQNGNSFGTTALLGTNDNQSLALQTSGSTRMFISSSGNVGIGTITPSASLHIVGTGSFSGLHLQNTTTASLGVPQNTPSITLTGASFQSPSSSLNQWRILGVGSSGASYSHELYFQSITGPSQTVQTPARLSQNGSLVLTNVLSAFSLSTFSGYVYGTGANTSTSGTTNYISTTGTFNPTSGTAILNYNNIAPTINQTGGANGITRGLYVNPTLTSAADFRAVENTVGNNLLNSTSGNTYIGLSTNAGIARLQVRGAGTTSATTTFLVQNSTPSTLFSILDNGNTGIGLASPSATLDVSGSVNISGSGIQIPFQINATGTRILHVSSSGKISIGSSANIGNALEIYDTGIYYAGASSQAQLLITTSGSVNREGAFIAASSGRTLQMGINDNSTVPVGIDMFETNNSYPSTYLNFRVNNADLVRMTGSFVGIGTTNPTTTLDVSGSARITNQLTLSNYTNSGSFPGTGSTMLTTDTSGNVLTQGFRDVAEQVYTGAIAWTGTAAPSGSTNHTYRWSQVGKTVNLNITLVYTGPGNAVSTVTTALPADCPTPYVPSGQSGAGALISVVSAHLTPTTTLGANIARGGLRINSTNNGYELVATATAAGYRILVTSVQYFAV